jgi:putative peptidoglycan lipid II flippase
MTITSATYPRTTHRVARSTVIVMGGMLASMAMGLVRQRIIAAKFGTTLTLDAYTAANGLPELLFTMLAGGALTFAFIPIYSEYVSSGDRTGGNRLVSQVVNSIFLLALLTSALAALAAPTLVSAPWGLGPHFPVETQRLTAELMRLLLVSTVLFAISSFATGVLHAHQHFLLPAISPIVFSVGVIFGALVLSPSLGIHGLAWGAIAGAALHLVVQIPGLIRYRVAWRPSFGWRETALRRVAVLMAPRVVDLMMARASIDWLNSNIGSGLGEGRLSALRFAFQIMNMPWTLVGTGIGIAVFPTLAIMVAGKDLSAQRRALSGALRAILTLTLPAAVGLLLLGRPIVQLLFEGGEFTSDSTDLVYFALRFYVVALVSQSVLEVVVRAFASRKDTLTPLLISIFTTGINVGLAFWLTRPNGIEHGGLALANGVAVGIESLIGLAILQMRWGIVRVRRVLADLARAGVACGAMALVILFVRSIAPPGAVAQLVIAGGLGALTYFAVALGLGIREIITLPLAVIRGARS